MKMLKGGLTLALLASFLSSYAIERLVPFDAALHKDIVMAIATETKDSLFPGLTCWPVAQRSMVEQASLKEFEQTLTKSGYIIVLLYVDGTPVGFVYYFAYKESCEAVLRGLEQRGISLDQLQQANPSFMDQLRAKFPEKDVDAPLLGRIEGIAVAKQYQHKGYGKRLFQHATEQLVHEKKVVRINLLVSEDNTSARKLYESEGFVVDGSRSMPMMRVVAYSKINEPLGT